MTERLISPRLTDIVEAIERIGSVLQDVPLEVFEGDWQKRWIVERGIQIISEASRHLPGDLKARHPEVPWRKVADIGNILRHEYDRTAPDIIWKLTRDDLSTLEMVCREELAAAQLRER